jgi:hypothetical protein
LQFLYNVRWPWQFRRMDEAVEADQAVLDEKLQKQLDEMPGFF